MIVNISFCIFVALVQGFGLHRLRNFGAHRMGSVARCTDSGFIPNIFPYTMSGRKPKGRRCAYLTGRMCALCSTAGDDDFRMDNEDQVSSGPLYEDSNTIAINDPDPDPDSYREMRERTPLLTTDENGEDDCEDEEDAAAFDLELEDIYERITPSSLDSLKTIPPTTPTNVTTAGFLPLSPPSQPTNEVPSTSILTDIQRGLVLNLDNNKRSFDDLSEEEIEAVVNFALDDEHWKTLSTKVEAVIESDWDIQQGVTLVSKNKKMPIKANLDLSTYHARQALNQRNNFTEATEIYERCIDYNPCDGRAWLGLARLQYKKGDILLAEKTFNDGLYYNPKNPYLMQALANMYEKMGKINQAMKLLRSSVISNPKHAASWVSLAQLNIRSGRVDESRFCFESAIKGDPNSYVAYQAWGVMEGKLGGNIPKARELFKKALHISKNSAHTLQAWATLEKKQGNLERAEKLLNKALEQFPNSTRALLALAEIQELRSDVNEVRNTFLSGERIAKKIGDAGFFQSWALFEIRQQQSEINTQNLIARNRNNNNNNNEREGYVNDNDGRSMDRISQSDPKASMLGSQDRKYFQTSRSYIRKLFRKAININKYHSATWIAWAKYEQRCGDLDTARKLLVEGISNFPYSKNIAYFHCCLGNIASQKGDINTARSCYNRALNSSPPHKTLSIYLEFAKMETKHGLSSGSKCDEVRDIFEKALKRFPSEERLWSQYISFEKRYAEAMKYRENEYDYSLNDRDGNKKLQNGELRAGSYRGNPPQRKKFVYSALVAELIQRREVARTSRTIN